MSAVTAEAYAAALTALPGMGPRRLLALLRRLAPDEAWHAARARRVPPEVDLHARDPGRLAAAWATAPVDPSDVAAACDAAGVDVHVLGADGYPEILAHDPEPPAVLFSRGSFAALDAPRVAIVGTRRCTHTGRTTARDLGGGLAEAGVAVVSGLALGIDGAAHEGVLASGGPGAAPIGVIGSGLDVVYPRRHAGLWRDVAARGLLLSEAPPGARPERWRFPARNRILAALADVVVVVESHARGGSQHTVDAALERDVPVMVVPGSVRSPASSGTNQLLADGAAPVRDVGDVLVALGLVRPLPPTSRMTTCAAPLDPAAQTVLDVLQSDPATPDSVARRTGLPPSVVLASLHRLEVEGMVIPSGGWWRTSQ